MNNLKQFNSSLFVYLYISKVKLPAPSSSSPPWMTPPPKKIPAPKNDSALKNDFASKKDFVPKNDYAQKKHSDSKMTSPFLIKTEFKKKRNIKTYSRIPFNPSLGYRKKLVGILAQRSIGNFNSLHNIYNNLFFEKLLSKLRYSRTSLVRTSTRRNPL